MEKKEQWSVEYSRSQECFHVDDLDYTLQRNMRTLLNGGADYKIIAIFDTQNEACEFASKCREKMESKKNEEI